MADLVSAWTDDRKVRLVMKDGDGVAFRSVPARWTLFATGLDEVDRITLARDSKVVGCRLDGEYTRIDCKNRWARRDVEEALKKAARANPDAGLEILEADVSPLVRLMADVGSLDVDPDPRLGFFDLETDSRATFTEMKEGHARILSWCIYDQKGNHWEAVLEEDTDDSERELISSFFEAAWGLDCLLAWNGDGFDFPVIQTRSEELGVRFRGRRVPWHRWTWLDQLEVFKKYNMHSDGGGEQKSSFKLGHVATYLLGEGKDDFDASKTWEAWAAGGEERAKLLAYCVKDTQLLPRIEEKTGFLGLHLAVCHICRIFPDTASLRATAQGDGFMLRLGTEHGYRWATRRRFDEAPQQFKGAYVMTPTRLGAIDSVHVCDFSGLYPSIMRTFNMSPDTKVTDDRRLAVQFRETLDKTDRMEPVIEPGICQLPNRMTWFRNDTDGMFRIALDTLVAKRAEYQAEMKRETPGTPAHARAKRLQGAFKIVANSFYGITGSPYSRFFDPEIAEGVTQTGRWLLESVIAEAKARELDPFYGDTDSVFIAGGVGSMKSLVAHMNQTWAQRLEPWGITDGHHIDLDFEKTFKRLIMISAKRYVGSFEMYKGKKAAEDAPPEVKGLEYKRGDTIRLAREMQTEIVTALLKPGPLPDPDDLLGVIRRWRDQVLNGDLELADLTITQSLSKRVEDYITRFAGERCMNHKCGYHFGSKDKHGPKKCPQCGHERAVTGVPAHVRVAKLMKSRGTPLGEGARVAYVVVGSENGIEAIPAADDDALARADRIYYWEKRIYPASGRVLEKVYPGSHWGESKGNRKDRKLESAGQLRLDLAPPVAVPRRRRRKATTPAPTTPAPKIPRRRKKKSGTLPRERPPGPRRRKVNRVVVTLQEMNPDKDGGVEAQRRRRILEAVRTAIEAHPGTCPVKVRITWTDPQIGDVVKVELETGLSVAKTTAARAALERVAVPGTVTGF